MRIAVAVKHVPEASEPKHLDPETLRLDRSVEGDANNADLNAVEEALRIKEEAAEGAVEVVVVSLGPPEAIDSLRKALAMGADRAVLVSDDDAAGSDLLATSYVLAAVLRREEPELVLFGQQAADSDGAVLWAAVAQRLRMPVISQVSHLTVHDGTVRGRRQTEFGYDVIEAPLPAVVAVSSGINDPRYPSLLRLRRAEALPTDLLALADLGVEPDRVGDAGSRTVVRSIERPPGHGDQVWIEDESAAAAQILHILESKGLV